MKKLLAVIVATVLLVGCAAHKPFLSPSAPFVAADVVAKSIGRLTQETPQGRELGICTAFSIDVRKFMTAAHCVQPITDMWGEEFQSVIKVDKIMASVAKVDVDRDLAVVIVDEVKPALTFRQEPLVLREDVQAMGFGHGFTVPLTTDNKVLALNFNLDEQDIWQGTLFLHPFVGGMSGGPIFDKDAHIVGVVQRASEFIAYGVSVETINEFLAQ